MIYHLDIDGWPYAFDRARNLPRFLRRAARETGDAVLRALGTLDDPCPALDALDMWVEEDWEAAQATNLNARPLCTATLDEMAYRAEHVDVRLAPLWAALQAQHQGSTPT
jgi:hypothetical protein